MIVSLIYDHISFFFIHIQDIFGKINEKCKIKKQDNKNVLLDFLHLTLTLYFILRPWYF